MRRRDDLPFPIGEYERRLTSVRQTMEHRGVDVLMVTVPENIYYISGFETTGYMSFQALFIPLAGEPFTVTRILEDTGVQALSWVEVTRPHVDGVDPLVHARDVLREFKLDNKRIGYERASWFFTAPQQERLFQLCPEANWIDCSGLVEDLRLIKSELELDKIRQAARYAEAAVQSGIRATAEGVTDNLIAAEMHYAMMKAGSDYPAVAPYIATGPRSAIGHATWSGRTLRKGDCVFLEAAGCRHRYHAAIMRTGWIGEPDAVGREAEKVILEAVQATIDAIRPGVPASELDSINRKLIARNSIGLQQLARSAYCIGTAFAPDWGEGHIFSWHPAEHRVLQPNMVFHLIPWALIPGRLAMGLSETIRVTKSGVELITSLPRQTFVR